MKKLLLTTLLTAILSLAIYVTTVYANPVSVVVSGEYQGINDWNNATYTSVIATGTDDDYGILSNGKYSFKYFPVTGQIKTLAAYTSACEVEPGFSQDFIVIPKSIEAFTSASVSYDAKSIVPYASGNAYGIFAAPTGTKAHDAFDLNIVVPEGVTTIPSNVFSSINRSNFNTNIILPQSLKTIETSAFQQQGYPNQGIFKNIIIPPNVTTIGGSAFYGCQFTDIDFPAGVTRMEDGVCNYASRLKNITFRGKISYVGSSAFNNNAVPNGTIRFYQTKAPIVTPWSQIKASGFGKWGTSTSYTVYYPDDGTGYDLLANSTLFPGTLGTTKIFTPFVVKPCKITSVSAIATGYTIGYSVKLGEDAPESVNTVALYNNNKLIAAKKVGSDQTIIDITTDMPISEAKLFVWNNCINANPICPPDTISYNSEACILNTPVDLRSPIETRTDTSAVLLWEKPSDYSGVASYNVYGNGELIGNTDKTFFKVTGLVPSTSYTYTVRSISTDSNGSSESNSIVVVTDASSRMYSVKDYGAVGDGTTKDTAAIQSAIDACEPGGVVYFPSGAYLSGALFLKSDMSLYVDSGAQIKGSSDVNDYPYVFSRFEGGEKYRFASLINAGTLDHNSEPTTSNIKIMGPGIIGDGPNGSALRKAENSNSRYAPGGLIDLLNCKNVYLDGFTARNGASWTIHPIYSSNITVYGLTFATNVANGDGFNPDSSSYIYVLNTTFTTGDDCLAIKSGKDQGGRDINRPTSNIYVRGCTMVSGHGGIVIGSEMSGGASDIYAEDCDFVVSPGIRIKSNPSRGGYIKNLNVRDSLVSDINAIMNYDTVNGSLYPVYQNFKFTNLQSMSPTSGTIKLSGVSNTSGSAYIENVEFNNCSFLNANLSYCKDIFFNGCALPEGISQSNCINVVSQ